MKYKLGDVVKAKGLKERHMIGVITAIDLDVRASMPYVVRFKTRHKMGIFIADCFGNVELNKVDWYDDKDENDCELWVDEDGIIYHFGNIGD